jgi:diguanylate cyclase (GGDEF)-like protein
VLARGGDGLTYAPEERRRLKKRGIVLATAGLLVTLGVAFGLRLAGLTQMSYRQWAGTVVLTLVVQGVLWLIPARGWDARLSFDPHYLYAPMVAAIVLLNTYVYVTPEARNLVLLLWFVALMFMVGRAGFRQAALLGAGMTIGYLMVLHWLSDDHPALNLPFEWLSALLFLATNLYAAVVLDRIRHKLAEGRALRRQLAELAATDPLTGLPNRRQCEAVLRAEIARVVRYGGCCALALIDVDYFKSYNDRLGHLAGDGLLRDLSALMREQLREADTLGRYGGDELAVIMPQTPKEEALRTIERLRAATERHGFRDAHLLPLGRLTISAGVSSCPDDARDYESLVRRADELLYRAKQLGRNRVQAA